MPTVDPRMLKYHAGRGVRSLIGRYGFELNKVAPPPPSSQVRPPQGWTCLNIGSGGYHIDGFADVDVPSDRYHSDPSHEFVRYNMREDPLPFEDGSVDLIYCSHVIEHIEDGHVERFIAEAGRVAKPGGVLRICVPDAEFLWTVSSFDNSYWKYRHAMVKSQGFDTSRLVQADWLTREVCTPRFRENANQNVPTEVSFSPGDLDQELTRLTGGYSWQVDHIGDHINWWTWDKVNRLASPHFTHVVRSKFGGSVSEYMQGPDFDKTQPGMSLYVECIK